MVHKENIPEVAMVKINRHNEHSIWLKSLLRADDAVQNLQCGYVISIQRNVNSQTEHSAELPW